MPRVITRYQVNENTVIQNPRFRSPQPLRAKLIAHGWTYQTSANTGTTDPIEGIVVFEFPYGPQDMQFQSSNMTFAQVKRPYLAPMLIPDTPQLQTVTFNVVIADRQSMGINPITEQLQLLEEIARAGVECEFVYGNTALPYSCHVTAFSYNVKYRNSNGEPVRAQANFQLTEKVPYEAEIVQLRAVYRQPEITVDGGGDEEELEEEEQWYTSPSQQQGALIREGQVTGGTTGSLWRTPSGTGGPR